MKKFKFTSETMTTSFGKTLHRIRAIADIVDSAGNVIARAGQLGGWLEKEENLSQDGNAWVYDNVRVHGNARVYENARVYGNALIGGNAWVCGNAWVFDDARVHGDTIICGDASIHDNAIVYGNATVYGSARVHGDAIICGDASIHDNAIVYGNATVYGSARVYGNAKVYGKLEVYGKARVCKDAVVKKPDHYLTVGPIGSRNDTTTFFRNAKGVIKVKCGCFIGTIDTFLKNVTATHGDNKHAIAYRAAAALAMAQIDTTVINDDLYTTVKISSEENTEQDEQENVWKHLYFKHANGEFSFVAANVGEESDGYIQILIAKHCKKINPNYKIPYFNRHMDILGRIWYDIGSETEEYVVF